MQNEFESATQLSDTLDTVEKKMTGLQGSAQSFARTMSSAFASSVIAGKSLDDALKNVGLRLSDLVLKLALQPVAQSIVGNVSGLFGNVFPGLGSGDVKPFAAGGVIGTPSYFPMPGGGTGLAGEAGPEAIMPLTRGPDGRLGVASAGGGANITVQISTPDAESFRRSESYVTGQIARAVARGQRSL